MQLKIIVLPLLSFMLYACNNGVGKSNDTQNMITASPETASADAAGNEEQIDGAPAPRKEPEQKQNPFTDSAATPPSAKNESAKPASQNIDWDKKIIKTANINAACSDYKEFSNIIHAKAKQYGAYIAQEQQEETSYKISNTITIKVPVALFDDFVNSLDGKGITIKEKVITSEDVTGEYVDTKSRLEAKLSVRLKYLELLKQAKNMDEILKVQYEINNIQEEIESAAGRVNYLKHASAYSTINLTFYEYLNGSSGNEDSPGFFTKMAKAFKTGGSIISNIILFTISIWPLIIAGITLLIYLKKRKSSSIKNNQLPGS